MRQSPVNEPISSHGSVIVDVGDLDVVPLAVLADLKREREREREREKERERERKRERERGVKGKRKAPDLC